MNRRAAIDNKLQEPPMQPEGVGACVCRRWLCTSAGWAGCWLLAALWPLVEEACKWQPLLGQNVGPQKLGDR